ncbi:MAG: DNA polymerase III subunit delta' [Alphaproteobacteria bacterium]|nr:DNA polymerase III subunit delta' [Alphaproteobacteria bacterium]
MTEAHHLVGHDAAMDEVAAAFASGRMHHAWLIAGIDGIGKARLAKHIALFALLGGRGDFGKIDPQHRVAKLVEAETHPDLLIIRRPVDEKTGAQKNTIPVDDVLKIATFLHKTATHGGWRVVILDEAHALNRNGQNAILKIVEEPPPRTLILITVTTPGILLPTIRSRCRMLELEPLDAEHMRAVLKREAAHVSDEDVTALIDLSGGSIGFALKVLRAEALPLYREMLGILGALPELDAARLHKLADQIGRKADAESFEVLTALLIERLRQTVHAESLHEPVGCVDLALDIWDKTRETFAAAERGNLDRKLAFINAITDIRAAV